MNTKKRMLATVAAVAAGVSLSMDEVENQNRQITVVVTQVPTGLASSGSPIPNAHVEYIEDGAAAGIATSSTTDANGSVKLTAGNPGVVTASKSGFTTISVGYHRDVGSTLKIALPPPASLSGSAYDMATRRAVRDEYVSVVTDYSVNLHSNAVLTENGSFSFDGLPPGPTIVIARAPGFAPTIASTTLIAGDSHNVDVGMLLEGAVSRSVVDAHGNAVADALVEVEYHGFTESDLLSTGIGGHVLTDDDGQFYVTGIVPNEGFSIYAELENGNRSDVQTLTTAAGTTLQNIVLTID